jgi:hypothetical protein
MAFHSLWLVWLQQQTVATAASLCLDQQPALPSSSSSSSNSSSSSFGSPATSAAEFDGLLDWLLEDDEQQKQQQQSSTVGMPVEPQPAATSSSSSSSSSSTIHSAVVAAVAGSSPAEHATGCSPAPDGDKHLQMPFTVAKHHLTDAAFWRSYIPAVHQQQRWHQLLQRGTAAAQLQYENMLANALDKAAAEDGSDYDLAGPGVPVVDAGTDAATGGLFWP